MSDSAPPDKCRRCGDGHELFACPHVKAIDLDGDAITRVEFLTPADFPREQTPKPEGAAVDGDNYPRLGATRRT